MEQKRTGLSYVFTLAKEERGKLSLGMLLAVFSSALSFVPYLVVYQILLLIIKQEVTLPAMLGWAGIGIAAAVLQAILTSFAGICSHTAAFNTMHRIKVRVLEHMSKFNLGFFQEHAPGQIKTTLFDDVDRIETFLAHSTLELAQAIVVPLMMFIFMLRLNWIMALIMLVPMILGIAIPMALMGRYPDLTDEFAGDTEKLNASANEFITAMPVIKMYHLTAEKFEQYRNSLKIYTDCWIKMCESSCNPLSIALVVLDSAILFTLPVGGWLYLRDSLSAASYLLFILLTMCFFTSFLNMVTIAMQSMELGSGLDTYTSTHNYDEYHFDLDEIEHDPYVLISILCVLHEGEWTAAQVQGTLGMLFDRQYILTERVVVETRYDSDDEPYSWYICYVTLENFDLSHLPVYFMGEEQLARYSLYMSTLGNRPDLFPGSAYVDRYVTNPPAGYEVPGEYLDDETFAAMLSEAEKYLGYPYVWGGSSPATSFDCSGFVSWVINHSGWNVGRLGAQGLYNICTRTSSPRPGDLVFFKGTYDTPGVSHVGIYVGDGMMIHCGDPISYANLNTSYWQSHFYAYGRLP